MSLNMDIRIYWLLEKETHLLEDSFEERFTFYFIPSCTFCSYYISIQRKLKLILNISKEYVQIHQTLSHGNKMPKERWGFEV